MKLIFAILLAMASVATGAVYNWTNTPNTTAYTPGDTVNFYGICVTPWAVTNSGTSGNPITFNVYARHVLDTLTDSTGFITINGKSYVSMIGIGASITLTNTGTAPLTYQRNCFGVDLEGTIQNITVSGFSITNLYNRTSNADANYYGYGVNMTAGCGTNIWIDHITNFMASTGIGLSWGTGGSCSNWNVSSNMCWQNVIALVMGETSAGATMDQLSIIGNDFGDMSQWSGQAGFHANNIHLYIGTFGTSKYTNTKVYGNFFHGPCSDHMTALTFFENNTGTVNCFSNLQVLNNLYTNGGAQINGNGFCFFKSVGAVVFNNTWVGDNHDQAVETGTGGSTPSPGVILTNNITYNVTFPVYDPQSWVNASDYNVFYASGGLDFNSFITFAQWQALGYDAHSKTSQPSLDANYVPTSGDTVAKDTGVSLSSYFTTDRIGTSRPQGPAWDIGAYEYTSGGAAPAGGQTIGFSGSGFNIR